MYFRHGVVDGVLNGNRVLGRGLCQRCLLQSVFFGFLYARLQSKPFVLKGRLLVQHCLLQVLHRGGQCGHLFLHRSCMGIGVGGGFEGRD